MEGTIAPEQIIINGQEYTPEDASRLIELGNKYQKIESDLNTSLDKVYPKYTQLTQEKQKLEADLAERTRALEEFQKKQQEAQVPADLQEVRRKAREAGLATDDYLREQGYMTRSEMEQFFNDRQNQQKLVDNILSKAQGLEKTIDGSDGRVPFDSDAVLAYASAYNIDDLEEAYDRMNAKANARWKQEQLDREQRPGLTTLKKGGTKEPEQVIPNDDNFKQLWDELYGTE